MALVVAIPAPEALLVAKLTTCWVIGEVATPSIDTTASMADMYLQMIDLLVTGHCRKSSIICVHPLSPVQ